MMLLCAYVCTVHAKATTRGSFHVNSFVSFQLIQDTYIIFILVLLHQHNGVGSCHGPGARPNRVYARVDYVLCCSAAKLLIEIRWSFVEMVAFRKAG